MTPLAEGPRTQWKQVQFLDGPLPESKIHYGYVPLDAEGNVPETLSHDDLDEIHINGWPHVLNATGYYWSEDRQGYLFDEQPMGEGPWPGV